MSVGNKAAARLLHEIAQHPNATTDKLVATLADQYEPGPVYAGLARLRREGLARLAGPPPRIGAKPNQWRLTEAGVKKVKFIITNRAKAAAK